METSAQRYRKAIEKLFLIVDKSGNTVPFKLNDPQNKILDALGRRDIVLKARQEGISTLLLALFTIDFLTKDNIRCVVISHEAKATQRLFDRVKFFIKSLEQTFPGIIPKMKTSSRSELINADNNSAFYVGTAGARAFGHGETIQNLHCSELSRWPDQEKLMVGLMQAVPRDGRIVIETTANGIGDYFYNLWKKSQTGNSTFSGHFLAWFDLAEYQIPIRGTFIPTEEEQELINTYKVSHEQLNWRRWKMSELGGNIDAFNEQFPSNAEEAFIVSGNPIWPPSILKRYLHRCKPPKITGTLFGAYQIFLEENRKGNLKVWQEPNPSHTYVIGADVAEGIEISEDGEKDDRLDYSCAVIMDRNTAEIVAVWHGRIDGDQFGRELDKLGRYYRNATIGVEKNFQGLTPLMMLRDLNYPHIYYREKIGLSADKMTPEMGWKTDRFTRPMMIDEGGKWIREEKLMIYDEGMVGEMMSFVRWPDGQGRAAKGAHDDRVMSLLIAVQMYIRNPATESGNPIERGGEVMFSDDNMGAPIDSPDGSGMMEF
jgi:hypothetical protein